MIIGLVGRWVSGRWSVDLLKPLRKGLLKKITNMCFFIELNETLNKAINSYENIIVIGDFRKQ